VYDEDFMEFMKELPVGFMHYLYEVYQLNEFADKHGVSPDNVGMSIQGDNFRMVFTSQPQPRKKPTKPQITDEEIAKLYTYILKNNLKGIDNTAT
jgi:hypothetical protein